MKWRLRDEPIWEGKTQETGDACCDAQKEDIPMEAGRLPEGELATLCNEGRYYISGSVLW